MRFNVAGFGRFHRMAQLEIVPYGYNPALLDEPLATDIAGLDFWEVELLPAWRV